MKRTASALLLALSFAATAQDPVHFATGVKVVEPESHSAFLWARLTRDAEPVDRDAPLPQVEYWDEKTEEWSEKAGNKHNIQTKPRVTFPEGATVGDLPGAAPGAPGDVRVAYRIKGDSEAADSGWYPVDPERDFTALIPLTGLMPGTDYLYMVAGRAAGASEPSAAFRGSFRTAPAILDPAKVSFAVSTGQRYINRDSDLGWDIYPIMAALDLDFFVHTGDVVYYDDYGKSPALARWHWQRTYSCKTNVFFHAQVASFFIKDDHDTLLNDCWPGEDTLYMGDLTWEDGLEIFHEQTGQPDPSYRTRRYGKDLQVWMVEGRDYRSPNTMKDGPDKTIWGDKQKQWFKDTVTASDATFRVLISPTPVVGPDRPTKNDNHANFGFKTEGQEIKKFIADQDNMFIVCGDRHWQYESQDKLTGVLEYSCGPASEKHAGGWSQEDKFDEHLFLAVHGGFLTVTAERRQGTPTLAFRHYTPEGDIRHERVHAAE